MWQHGQQAASLLPGNAQHCQLLLLTTQLVVLLCSQVLH
jgi:hypothetical protein